MNRKALVVLRSVFRIRYSAILRFITEAHCQPSTVNCQLNQELRRFPKAFGITCLALSVSLILLIISCNKSARNHENKAFVSITHTAQNTPSLDIFYDGNSILGGTLLTYGQTTGQRGSPYIQATAGVRELQVMEAGQPVLQGNTAFQQGYHYSLFLYDTLNSQALKIFILQDNLPLRTDTFTYIRFMNFSPGTYLNLVLTSKRDTVATGFADFAGNNVNPTNYPFRQLHIGSYATRVFRDTVFANSIPLDSLQVDSTKDYTIFLQGSPDSAGINKLMLKSIQHN